MKICTALRSYVPCHRSFNKFYMMSLKIESEWHSHFSKNRLQIGPQTLAMKHKVVSGFAHRNLVPHRKSSWKTTWSHLKPQLYRLLQQMRKQKGNRFSNFGLKLNQSTLVMNLPRSMTYKGGWVLPWIIMNALGYPCSCRNNQKVFHGYKSLCTPSIFTCIFIRSKQLVRWLACIRCCVGFLILLLETKRNFLRS